MSENIIFKEKVNEKIKRKKFFLYSGVLAFGMVAASKFPFNLFNTNQKVITNKESSIKITQNPNAVKRNSRQENNG
ncbi:MAG TPA: hypothetical protein PKC91_15335 [Ignavibacteria bacterium]|nr:hypothetical protein [Ignavibacteria bacterium]